MGIRLGDIAKQFDLTLLGDANTEITGLAALQHAGPSELTFLFSSQYKKHLPETGAAAVVLRPEDSDGVRLPVLISERPRLAWAQIATLFDPLPKPSGTIADSAVVSASAKLGQDVSIGEKAVIEDGAVLGNGVTIGAGSIVGAGTVIGDGTRLHANVTLYHNVELGTDCIVHAGAVIGADGFGFEFDGVGLTKIPQIYGVTIGNQVEIGAGTTIDRGALNDTTLGDGVKLDNQVQVGHGTTIGANTAISGCTAIAGSTKIGSYCLIGGAVGIIDNIEITDQVEVTAMSLVSQSIKTSGRYSSGTGLMAGKEWKRNIVGFRKLDDMLKRLRKIEKKLS